MSILTTLLIAASALGQSAGKAVPEASSQNQVTVSGCVSQPPRTGSLANETAGATSATPNTAGIEANSSEPVNAFVLLDATPFKKGPGEASLDARTSYALQGHEAELAVHRGHRVEIVGYLMPSPPRGSS